MVFGEIKTERGQFFCTYDISFYQLLISIAAIASTGSLRQRTVTLL